MPVQLANSIVTTFPASSSRASCPLELVHTDLSGPARVPGPGGVVYRLTITDDFTRWRWLKLLTNKREETILEAFKEYKAMAEAQHPACRLVTIQDDKGAEFIGNRIEAWCKEHGIQPQHTVRATPQQNGRAERDFRNLAESATCISARAGMSISWWAEAAHASNCIYNRFPHCALGCTPFELWMATSPISPICVSGDAWLMSTCRRTRGRSPSTERTLGSAHSLPYHDDHKGWEFLHHETSGRVVSRDVLWQEDAFRHISHGFLGPSSMLCCSLLHYIDVICCTCPASLAEWYIVVKARAQINGIATAGAAQIESIYLYSICNYIEHSISHWLDVLSEQQIVAR